MLTIKNFRGVRAAELHFSGNTLLVGGNNVGKSTICEALDLVLGPDSTDRSGAVDEYDFCDGRYLDEEGKPIELRIEVVVTKLSAELTRLAPTGIEHWDKQQRRVLGEGELKATDAAHVERCLRMCTIAKYDAEEDALMATTYFSRSLDAADENPAVVTKRVKRAIGFLYLRALRTGTRALSLDRGSLLDLLLRAKGLRVGIWEGVRRQLRDLNPPVEANAPELRAVLERIEERLAEYIPLQRETSPTRLFVSQLTRDHLRKTLAFFLSVAPKQQPVPFQSVGTGTLSLLVLSLLTLLADNKKDSVIFAMEEPEMALPPHSQRRVLKYLLSDTDQCFVTSHSPYVIERFEPEQIRVLTRSEDGTLTAAEVVIPSTVKAKTYRNFLTRGIAEAMLGRGVVVGEGRTEQLALAAVARHLEDANADLFPLDLAGVSVVQMGGEGSLAEIGRFFRALGLVTFAFYDKRKGRTEAQQEELSAAYDMACETQYMGIEALLVAEVPPSIQWKYLEARRRAGDFEADDVPEEQPETEDAIRESTLKFLKRVKGEDRGAPGLLNLCDTDQLPPTITTFLKHVYAKFPAPARPTRADANIATPVVAPPAQSRANNDPDL